MTYANNDPKGASGAKKIPLHLVPPSIIHGIAEALADGARKYGPYNWRNNPVCASTYYAAVGRHKDSWWDGEDVALDSLVHHIKHVAASCAIIIDAHACGMLIDDRPPPGAASRLQAEYVQAAEQAQADANLLKLLRRKAPWEEGYIAPPAKPVAQTAKTAYEQKEELDRIWDAINARGLEPQRPTYSDSVFSLTVPHGHPVTAILRAWGIGDVDPVRHSEGNVLDAGHPNHPLHHVWLADQIPESKL